MTSLRSAWLDHLQAHPRARTLDVAQALGVSECELLFSRVGEDAVQLRPDWKTLLTGLPALGEVMALTRNANVVHESTGPFEKVEYRPHMAGVYGEHIDQRLIVARWAVAIAAPVENRNGVLQSLQIFDSAGSAVLKIYSRKGTDLDAWNALVDSLRQDEPALPELAPLPDHPDPDDADIDAQGLRDAWAAMTDTHQVHPLLRRLGVGRQQALRLLGTEWAVPVRPEALEALITACAEESEPIMVFVGNTGSIQIFSGTVKRVVPMDTWFNIMDPAFNLHVRREGLKSAWVVRKPTDRGLVLSLEVFDEDQEMAVQLFGKRTEDRSQAPTWHARIEALVQDFPILTEVTA